MKPIFQKNGYAAISGLIAHAMQEGKHIATLHGDYEIEQTVLLPSDFTLVLEDCHLKMADNTFCNMFRNAGYRRGEENRLADADRDIHLIGRGRAILDGGNYNGLSESTSAKNGNPHISVNNILLFCNVENFSVEGIHVRNQRWWALNFIHCRHGLLRDIDFLSDFTHIDKQGNRVQGLGDRVTGNTDYASVYIKNSDGIDLRTGCHDFLIENITGYTEDDTVALTNLNGSVEKMYTVVDDSTDLHDVIIRNVRSGAFCSNVRLLNQGGTRLFNILVDGVTDISKDCGYFSRGGNGVRLGDDHMYGDRHSTADETFNVVIKNVYSRSTNGICIRGAMTNFHYENIFGFDGCETPINIK